MPCVCVIFGLLYAAVVAAALERSVEPRGTVRVARVAQASAADD